MTHPPDVLVCHISSNMSPTVDTGHAQCDDLPTAWEWLRVFAVRLLAVRTLRALAVVLVHVADALTRWRHGRSAVLYPSRTGGRDFSARAVLTARNPMVFGGVFTTGIECSLRHRSRAPKVVAWAVPRRRVLASGRATARGTATA